MSKMALLQEKIARWREQLKNTYRLVVMNDETFEEVGSYKLTMFNFYVLISSIIVVVAVSVALLIAFTPVKRYLPGYGSGESTAEVLALSRQLDKLEKEMEAQRMYTKNIQKVLVGDVETADDVPEPSAEQQAKLQAEATQPSPELTEVDQQLRSEVELERIGAISQQGQATTARPVREIPIEQLYFVSPISGEISSGFNSNKSHYGVDILAPKNTAIKAAMDGYVFLADWTIETGNTIGIQHEHNLVTFYKHNSTLLKKVGSFVKAGEAIAIIGNTGTLTDGPHLHFELWYRGKPIDPSDYITF
ncbi:MAG: M23 family metallopeptidase [Lewinellaceae bacterium]|nr:M23 family metallopeptidase [Lewinellaceae bacterium]